MPVTTPLRLECPLRLQVPSTGTGHSGPSRKKMRCFSHTVFCLRHAGIFQWCHEGITILVIDSGIFICTVNVFTASRHFPIAGKAIFTRRFASCGFLPCPADCTVGEVQNGTSCPHSKHTSKNNFTLSPVRTFQFQSD